MNEWHHYNNNNKKIQNSGNSKLLPIYIRPKKNAELLDLIVTTLSNSKNIVLDFTATATQH